MCTSYMKQCRTDYVFQDCDQIFEREVVGNVVKKLVKFCNTLFTEMIMYATIRFEVVVSDATSPNSVCNRIL